MVAHPEARPAPKDWASASPEYGNAVGYLSSLSPMSDGDRFAAEAAVRLAEEEP